MSKRFGIYVLLCSVAGVAATYFLDDSWFARLIVCWALGVLGGIGILILCRKEVV